MNMLSLAPKVSPADVEGVVFNTHIQDVLLVAYSANTIGTKIDLSNRLASTNFGATTPTPAAATTNTTTTSATPAAGGKYQTNQYKNGFLYSKKKKKYIFLSIVGLYSISSLPPFCFHPCLKMGALAGGRLVGNDKHWGRVISVCMYTLALGLVFAW